MLDKGFFFQCLKTKHLTIFVKIQYVINTSNQFTGLRAICLERHNFLKIREKFSALVKLKPKQNQDKTEHS